jgi:uncharacterized membrane protein YdbT with pleckstrin-like domain
MDGHETIIKKVHPHPFSCLGYYFLGIIFVVGGLVFYPLAIIIGLLLFGFTEIKRRAETFYILDSGVAREYRLLSTSRKFAEYEKIQNVEVSQSLAETMFGIGSIHLDTAGTDTREVSFRGARDPYGIERIIREKMKSTS